MNTDAWIEDYLDHVCAPLVGVVPYDSRQELRRELDTHLQALVATHQELGSRRDVAVVAALRQFGDPERLARHWARAHSRAPASSQLQPFWTGVPAALACFGSATAIGWVLMLSLKILHPPWIMGWGAWMLSLYVLPLLAGLATGLRAQARHALGAFFALAATIPGLALVYLTNDVPSGLAPPAEAATDLALIQAVLWAPIGCGSAALGGWLQGRLPLRRRRWVLQ